MTLCDGGQALVGSGIQEIVSIAAYLSPADGTHPHPGADPGGAPGAGTPVQLRGLSRPPGPACASVQTNTSR